MLYKVLKAFEHKGKVVRPGVTMDEKELSDRQKLYLVNGGKLEAVPADTPVQKPKKQTEPASTLAVKKEAIDV